MTSTESIIRWWAFLTGCGVGAGALAFFQALICAFFDHLFEDRIGPDGTDY